MHAIGIDMSKRSFHAAFDENTVRQFSNTESGIELFLDDLARRRIASCIGIEATGAYHLLFCAALAKRSWRVNVINPLATHHVVAAQSLRRVKTDGHDALAIRRMAQLGHGYPFMETDATIALKALVVEREGLVQMRSVTKHRLEAHRAKQDACTAFLHNGYSNLVRTLQSEVQRFTRRPVGYTLPIARVARMPASWPRSQARHSTF